MHLTVFGGTGGTGEQVIRAALDAGHTVTAPARDPSKIRMSHERLRTVRADVLDAPSLASTLDGADAVVSALGVPGGKEPTRRVLIPAQRRRGPDGYRPSRVYLASVASFCGFHHHSLWRYQSIVAASPARKLP
ncbi:MAG: NAD(P)H-binding protein [Pseudonocardiaceae bacterium]